MPKVNSSDSLQLIIVLSVLILLLTAAILYFGGFLTGGNNNKQYKNVTLTDAQYACEQYTRKTLGSRLKVLSVDTHSTRFDEVDQRYKIFMQAQMKQGNKKATQLHYVHCFSLGKSAEVDHFEVTEDADYKPIAGGRENMFGL